MKGFAGIVLQARIMRADAWVNQGTETIQRNVIRCVVKMGKAAENGYGSVLGNT